MSIENKQDFYKHVIEHLEPLTENLIDSLAAIFDSDFDGEVALLRFEIFPDGFRECLPISVFLLDEAGDECDYYSVQLLVEVDGVYPTDFDLFDSLEAAGVDIYKTSASACVAWFAGCWKRVPGSCPVKAEIGVHDELEFTQL